LVVVCLAAILGGAETDDAPIRAAGAFVVLAVPFYVFVAISTYAVARLCFSVWRLSRKLVLCVAGAVAVGLGAMCAFSDPFGLWNQLCTFAIFTALVAALSLPTALLWCRLAKVS